MNPQISEDVVAILTIGTGEPGEPWIQVRVPAVAALEAVEGASDLLSARAALRALMIAEFDAHCADRVRVHTSDEVLAAMAAVGIEGAEIDLGDDSDA